MNLNQFQVACYFYLLTHLYRREIQLDDRKPWKVIYVVFQEFLSLPDKCLLEVFIQLKITNGGIVLAGTKGYIYHGTALHSCSEISLENSLI